MANRVPSHELHLNQIFSDQVYDAGRGKGAWKFDLFHEYLIVFAPLKRVKVSQWHSELWTHEDHPHLTVKVQATNMRSALSKAEWFVNYGKRQDGSEGRGGVPYPEGVVLYDAVDISQGEVANA